MAWQDISSAPKDGRGYMERLAREGAPIHEQLARLEMENMQRIYGERPVKLRLAPAPAIG